MKFCWFLPNLDRIQSIQRLRIHIVTSRSVRRSDRLCALVRARIEPPAGGRERMDGRRFDELTRALSSSGNRRRFLKGIFGAGLGAAGLARLAGTEAAPQATQAQCGNTSCKNNPGKCSAGCVCCVYGNGNNRCMSPGACNGTPTCPPGKVADPALGCVDCLTAANCPSPADGNPCLAAACIAGKCGIQPGNTGATCGQTTCASGAVTSYAYISDGTCAPSSTTPCDPYTCASDGISCRSTCAGDGDCVPGAFCLGGQCVGDLGLGQRVRRTFSVFPAFARTASAAMWPHVATARPATSRGPALPQPMARCAPPVIPASSRAAARRGAPALPSALPGPVRRVSAM